MDPLGIKRIGPQVSGAPVAPREVRPAGEALPHDLCTITAEVARPRSPQEPTRVTPSPAPVASHVATSLLPGPIVATLRRHLQAGVENLRRRARDAFAQRHVDPLSALPRPRPPAENEAFIYSPQQPPPLEVLEERMFVVHATPVLPRNGVLVAGARDISKEAGAPEPPSFRPTIHFSQGEVVRGHGGYSWDENPFAVVAPLQALEPQLLNVYPHDTYVLGDFQLDRRSTLVVPRGTPLKDVPKDVPVVEYAPGTTLREAVERVVESRGGWAVRMRDGDVGTGAEARIQGTEINDPRFFKDLFTAYPHASYGTHLNAERGEAFRFGNVEQATQLLMRGYQPFGFDFSTDETRFYRAFVDHNLIRLDGLVEAPGRFSPDALRAYREKKSKVRAWMNVVEEDLALRSATGRTLARAPEEVGRALNEARFDPAALHRVAGKALPLLHPANTGPLSVDTAAEAVSSFAPDELDAFLSGMPDVTARMDMPAFHTDYALRRWITVGTERAHQEGLDRILAQALAQRPPTEKSPIEVLSEGLKRSSTRLETCLEIMREPAVLEYLNGKAGFTLPADGPRTFLDALKGDPQTRVIFNPPTETLGADEQRAQEVLVKLGVVREHHEGPPESVESRAEARSRQFSLEYAAKSARAERETILQQPMRATRSDDELMPGDRLNAYEIVRRDCHGAEGIWTRLDLGTQFRKRFPDDADSWSSDRTLMQIYEDLSSMPR